MKRCVASRRPRHTARGHPTSDFLASLNPSTPMVRVPANTPKAESITTGRGSARAALIVKSKPPTNAIARPMANITVYPSSLPRRYAEGLTPNTYPRR